MNSPRRSVVTLKNGTEFVFFQEKGQKKYGPPPGWLGPPPPKGCEIFIGKLPRDVFENELIPLFASVGNIYEFRLMVDFSLSSRGYAFVTYTNKEDAEKAIRTFNKYAIRSNRNIGVCKSINNCKLFIRGIPVWSSQETVLNEIRELTEGVIGVEFSTNCYDANKNIGFAFVEYESHRAASIARRVLLADDVTLFGRNFSVDWADPEQEINGKGSKQVATLYVRNIPFQIDEDTLHTIFSVNDQFPIQQIKKIKNFAFIYYFYKQDAQKSLARLNGSYYKGWLIEVTWAKPHLSTKKSEEKKDSHALKQNFVPNIYNWQHFNPPSHFFSNPIQALRLICLDSGWGLPVYHIIMNKTSIRTPYFSYSAKVFIPNLPLMGLLPSPTRVFFSPYEAKYDAALSALKKLGFETGLSGNSSGLVNHILMNFPNVAPVHNALELKESDPSNLHSRYNSRSNLFTTQKNQQLPKALEWKKQNPICLLQEPYWQNIKF